MLDTDEIAAKPLNRTVIEDYIDVVSRGSPDTFYALFLDVEEQTLTSVEFDGHASTIQNDAKSLVLVSKLNGLDLDDVDDDLSEVVSDRLYDAVRGMEEEDERVV